MDGVLPAHPRRFEKVVKHMEMQGSNAEYATQSNGTNRSQNVDNRS